MLTEMLKITVKLGEHKEQEKIYLEMMEDNIQLHDLIEFKKQQRDNENQAILNQIDDKVE